MFNLRGNQRTSGELSRKEGRKIFGSGSRTPIAITLLVKNTQSTNKKAIIHYHDIGDYLNREEKLSIVKDFKSIDNPSMQWKTLEPNEHGDWLNLRNDIFNTFIQIELQKKFDTKTKSVFVTNAVGVATGRDSWVYNFSKEALKSNMGNMISFYNNEVEKILNNSNSEIGNLLDYNSEKISWTVNLKKDIEKQKNIVLKYLKWLYHHIDPIVNSIYTMIKTS